MATITLPGDYQPSVKSLLKDPTKIAGRIISPDVSFLSEYLLRGPITAPSGVVEYEVAKLDDLYAGRGDFLAGARALDHQRIVAIARGGELDDVVGQAQVGECVVAGHLDQADAGVAGFVQFRDVAQHLAGGLRLRHAQCL